MSLCDGHASRDTETKMFDTSECTRPAETHRKFAPKGVQNKEDGGDFACRACPELSGCNRSQDVLCFGPGNQG